MTQNTTARDPLVGFGPMFDRLELPATEQMKARCLREWRDIAGEAITIECEGSARQGFTVTAFGSELACLRLEHAFRKPNAAHFSKNLNTWYFRSGKETIPAFVIEVRAGMTTNGNSRRAYVCFNLAGFIMAVVRSDGEGIGAFNRAFPEYFGAIPDFAVTPATYRHLLTLDVVA